jgi:hypothetical protein
MNGRELLEVRERLSDLEEHMVLVRDQLAALGAKPELRPAKPAKAEKPAG